MHEHDAHDLTMGEEFTDPAVETDPAADAASSAYVDRWNRLVSTTNWQKGRIILEWRKALLEAGAPPADCTDEAWSRRVGGVSPQHIGRLRRVYERFGAVCDDYPGLYWSHFQAALDWPDAEMWLEGAVQGRWSISRMRQARWEALGAPPELRPRDEDVIHTDFDEDFPSAEGEGFSTLAGEGTSEVRGGPAATGDEEASPVACPADDDFDADEAPAAPAGLVRPFEGLDPLPDDLEEAVEAMKLAIIHHKAAGWSEASLETVLGAIDGLRQLALAPS